jgi:hypothetical protein
VKIASIILVFSFALGAPAQEKAAAIPDLSVAIDRALEARWKKDLKGEPAPICDDAEFLRRLSLDLRGRPAGVAETRAFLASASESKRLAKIDEYLASQEFARQWSRRFASILFNNYQRIRIYPGKNLNYRTTQRLVGDFLAALQDRIAKDKPAPEILDELLEAQGRTDQNPMVLYKLSMWGGDVQYFEFADRISKSWLGISVSCARCHDHPFDQWTQEDFYGLAGFFTREKLKLFDSGGSQSMGESCDEVELAEDLKAPELTNPESGGQLKPTFLFGGQVGSSEPRMRKLAALLTTGGQNQLARNLSNRVWEWLMGRALVHPVYDFNKRNKASIPPLLEKLTTEYAAGRYSLKKLVRAICASKGYQRSSTRAEPGDVKDYARGTMRALTAEQLFLSVTMASRGGESVPDRTVGPMAAAWGWYSGQMDLVYGPGTGWNEVTPLPGNSRQMLLVRNGEIFQMMMKLPGGTVTAATQIPGSPAEKVEFVFLSVLGRKPVGQEVARWASWLERKPAEPGLQDMLWTLINSTEFLTRH